MNKTKGTLLPPRPFKNFTTIHDQHTKDIVEICLNAGYNVYVFTDDNDMERQQVFTPTQCCNCGTELSVGIHSIDSANNIEKTIKIYNTCNNCIDEKIARKFIKESCSKAVPDWDECLIGSLWSNGLDDHTCSLFVSDKEKLTRSFFVNFRDYSIYRYMQKNRFNTFYNRKKEDNDN